MGIPLRSILIPRRSVKMKEDPAAPVFVAYFLIFAILAVGSWLHIRSRPTPHEKKRWFDRWCIIIGAFVTGSVCLILVIWERYIGIPLFIAAGIGITIMNLRNTYYCASCGKRSFSQNWFCKTFHCPHCGTKLK
jgi:DNA-directed RNA polymerase subunit RPC12/RpoP